MTHGAGRGIGTLGESNQAQPAYAGPPRTRCDVAHLPTILARVRQPLEMKNNKFCQYSNQTLSVDSVDSVVDDVTYS